MQEWYFDDIPLNQPMTTKEYVVPEDEMVAFARKWDPQPFHTDPEAAKASPHGGLIAPTAYTYAVATALANQLDPAMVPIAGVEQRLRLTHPVRPGDRLVATVECVHKRLSRTKPDRGIVRVVSTVRNQEGQGVLLWESTFLVSRRAPGRTECAQQSASP